MSMTQIAFVNKTAIPELEKVERDIQRLGYNFEIKNKEDGLISRNGLECLINGHNTHFETYIEQPSEITNKLDFINSDITNEDVAIIFVREADFAAGACAGLISIALIDNCDAKIHYLEDEMKYTREMLISNTSRFVNELANIESRKNIDEQRVFSTNKFIILSILTFGLYTVWWAYKAWLFFQQKDELEIMPAIRAYFGVIFLIPLTNRILDYAKQKGYQNKYSPILIFVCFVVCSLLGYLPQPFWLIAYLNVVFLIPPFKALKFAKQNSQEITVIKQSSFSKRQIFLIVIGATCWIFLILGLLIENV